jgi:hypothetical protein
VHLAAGTGAQGLLRRVRDQRRGPAHLLQPEIPGPRLDGLKLVKALHRPTYLHPAAVKAGLDPVDLRETIVAIFLRQEVASNGIKGHAEAVAKAVGKDFLKVSADLAASQAADAKEGVVLRGAPVVIEAQDHAGQVGVVRLRPSKLVVTAIGQRPDGNVLQPAAAAVIADQDIELAVRAKANLATVVVAPQGLIEDAILIGIRLKGAELDQVRSCAANFTTTP